MKKTLILNLSASMALVFLLISCLEKAPVDPPTELVNKISALEATYSKLKETGQVSPDQLSGYEIAMAETKAAKDSGDFKKASKFVRIAQMEMSKIDALMEFKKLEVYNPSNELTFHYRKGMQEGDDLKAAGEVEAATQKYIKAKEQVTMSLSMQSQCIKESKENVEKTKKQLEYIYKPDSDVLAFFWDTVDALPNNDCQRISQNLLKIQKYIDNRAKSTISEKRIFMVTATQDHVKKYGDPIMYSEVRSDGYLQNRINRVPTGFPVYFIRSMLFDRNTIFYLVKDPRTNIEGWMAERYVWPERTSKRNSVR